jgi:hypothetical protein
MADEHDPLVAGVNEAASLVTRAQARIVERAVSEEELCAKAEVIRRFLDAP